ncbi:MAG: metallophosphatase family protein [Bacteroidales bacterium]|nr:metallophosphatase family protein [Bacteroidales bacterium]
MTRIGLLSDTHGYLPPDVFEAFGKVDEIWHAGDIGTIALADKLSGFKPLRAVYGNIDGQDIRSVHPKNQLFYCEGVKVFMTHIGGYPKRYEREARQIIDKEKPQLFISGHSHILKVMNDHKRKMLHINPGAAGKSGLHKMITMVRFYIDGNRIEDLEVIEMKRSKG